MEWIKTYGILVAMVAAVGAIVVVSAHPNKAKTGRDKKPAAAATWHGETSAQHPGPLHDVALREVGTTRATVVSDVYEAPPAAGSGEGTCFVELGVMPVGGSRDGTTVTLAYAANGIVLDTGDADLACNADAIEHSRFGADGSGYRPVEVVADLVDAQSDREDFIHVTYLLGDVEPDVVVITAGVPEPGRPAPDYSEFAAFELSNPDGGRSWGAVWDTTFGLSYPDREGA
jgi:hypothetical protein